MSIEERIKLNKLEYIDLLKNYFDNVLSSMLTGYYDFNDIKFLISLLKKYKVELEEETAYLEYLLTHTGSIREEELLRILKLIDDNNKDTYVYYDSIGDKYSEKAHNGRPLRFNEEECKSLLDNYKLTDEIKGITLTTGDIDRYYKDIIQYRFLRNGKVKVIDCGNDLTFYGVYPQLNDNKIFGVSIVVPPVYNLKTALINVHEFRYGIDVMDMFGREFPEEYDFEERAKKEEMDFIEHYVRNK